MLLYADENFHRGCVEELRLLGYDVLTVAEDGQCSSPDPDILARAFGLGRIVITFNRWDYEKLHRQGQNHCGILSATPDLDHAGLAARIHAALSGKSPLRWCLRVNKPNKP